MTCPHATTTTVAWCYGEAPDDHAEHVAGCAECQAVVAEHEAVLASVVPVAQALAEPSPAAVERSPPPANRPWAWLAGGVLAAAAAALWFVPSPVRVAPSPPSPDQVAAVDTAPPTRALRGTLPALGDVDARLDALELELDALSADPSLL